MCFCFIETLIGTNSGTMTNLKANNDDTSTDNGFNNGDPGGNVRSGVDMLADLKKSTGMDTLTQKVAGNDNGMNNKDSTSLGSGMFFFQTSSDLFKTCSKLVQIVQLAVNLSKIDKKEFVLLKTQLYICISNFYCMFLNPNIFFSNLRSNCSNLLDMRNLQEQVKKAFRYQKLSS